jgi:hypothetical protein
LTSAFTGFPVDMAALGVDVGVASPKLNTWANVGLRGEEFGSSPKVAIVHVCCHTFPTGVPTADACGGVDNLVLFVERNLSNLEIYTSPSTGAGRLVVVASILTG